MSSTETAPGFLNSVIPFESTNSQLEAGTKRKQGKLTDQYPVTKRNRFNGMSEEEVMKRGLPDYLREGLDIVFVGINPGLAAAYTGHYYTGPGNHFWKCLFLSGIIDKEMTSKDDYELFEKYNIGFTNMVSRTTRGSSDLNRQEIAEGGKILTQKMQKYQPKIVVFNGKVSYEIYSKKKKFQFGLQNEKVSETETHIWVMPSSSARCAQLPRATDKVLFFEALKQCKEYLKGERECQNPEKEFVFADLTLKGFPRKKKD